VSGLLDFAHRFGATVLIIYAVVLGLWGVYLYFRKEAVTGGFRSSFLIMAGVTALQGLAGLGVLLLGSRPHEILHVVYGAFAVLFLPGAYLYGQGGTKRREAVVLAGACWIVAIAYFRGFATG
jgi:hypothetical protein